MTDNVVVTVPLHGRLAAPVCGTRDTPTAGSLPPALHDEVLDDRCLQANARTFIACGIIAEVCGTILDGRGALYDLCELVCSRRLPVCLSLRIKDGRRELPASRGAGRVVVEPVERLRTARGVGIRRTASFPPCSDCCTDVSSDAP